jgi:hypothetical protein
VETSIIHVLFTATVEYLEKWRSAFAAAAPLRRHLGSTGVRVFHQSGKPNEVNILGEYESLEKARALFNSP